MELFWRALAAPALRRTVGRLAAGGYMPAECGECALDVAVVQRAFSGHRAPLVVPDEVWTQFSTSVEVDSLHRWLTANNAGRRFFNMMLAAGHANPRGRAPEARIGERLLIGCDLAPACELGVGGGATFVAS